MDELKTLDSVRIDKWLWAVRICKTRQVAADLCKRQKVYIDGQLTKPSRDVRPGNVIMVKRDGVEWQYRVVQCIEKRVSAKLAAECKEDITPKEQLERRESVRKMWVPRRPKGAGRPTKKDRRDMEKFLDD